MSEKPGPTIIDSVSLSSEKELDKQFERYSSLRIEEDSKIWYDSRLIKDASKGARRRLIIVTSVCLTFIIVETIGAILSNSIAIMTDVAHLASDLLGFMLSIIALFYAKKSATKEHSWGFARAECIGAFCSVVVIWVLTLWIYYVAFSRLITKNYGNLHPEYMIMTASFGILANLVMMKSLHMAEDNSESEDSNFQKLEAEYIEKPNEETKKSNLINNRSSRENEDEEKESLIRREKEQENLIEVSKEDKNLLQVAENVTPTSEGAKSKNLSMVDDKSSDNVRAAIIHVLGDLVASLGVLIVAIIIYLRPEWCILDPIISIMFATIALAFTIPVTKNILSSMMDMTPPHFELEEFQQQLRSIPFLIDFHDFHVWQISSGKPSMIVHVVVSDHLTYVLKKVTVLARKYGIYHSAVQVEKEGTRFAINCAHNVHN